MNVFDRMRAAGQGFVSGWWTGNVFMGANESSVRTPTAQMPIDSRREVTWANRYMLIKKSRWLDNNLGLMRRLKNGTARYTVGTGIAPIPDTKDRDWNNRADDWFTNWASTPMLCDTRQQMSFWRIQKAMCRAMFRDGGSFGLKAPSANEVRTDGSQMVGSPSMRWHEATTVSNLFQNNSMLDDEGYREGIKIDPSSGRVLSYRFLYDKYPAVYDQTGFETYPKDSVVHLHDPERAAQLHGLPWIYHGANSAIDMLDLTALEKHAHKLHAAMAGAIKRRSGQAPKGGFTGNLVQERRDPAIPGKGSRPTVITYENFAGGAGILNLGLDEDFQLFTSQRQSHIFSGFIDFLVRDIAWGFGTSPEFIWSVVGLGGPNGRMILEDAKWFFEEIQDLIVELLCQPIYVWAIARAIERGELPKCSDPEWWVAHWQGPAKITIDQGKEGALELDRMAMGCNTWEEYWALRGKNGRKMVFKRIDELAEAMAYAKTKGVPFELVFSQAPGTPSAGPGSPQGDEEAD
jgi:capsid protein